MNLEKQIIAISISNETRKSFKDLDKLRPNTYSFSSFLGVAARHYVKTNSNEVKIEDFANSEASVTPLFYAEIPKWENYIKNLTPVEYNKFSERLQQLTNIKRIKLGGMLTW